MKICLQKGTKGAPFYEQKELQRSGERRRRVFANGAGELWRTFPPMVRMNCKMFIPDTAANLILPCRPVRKIRP